MRVAVTGAGGFVGRRLVKTLLAPDAELGGIEELVLADARLPAVGPDRRLRRVEGDLADSAVRDRIVGDGVDVLFHLAAVPGGAAEADYPLSKRVNLHATLALVEAAAAQARPPRIVYTSTIAVFGAALPPIVDDDTPRAPELTYGAHKLMVEIALADLSRRGAIDARTVRLPGIVARPAAASGMRSAFMSDVFHALLAKRPFVCPVSPEATMWMMSAAQCAWNLSHAASLAHDALPPGRAATLPALRLTMAELVQAICAEVGADPGLVSYAPDADLEAHFGAYPPLRTPAADQAGFRHDGEAQRLVRQALADIADPA